MATNCEEARHWILLMVRRRCCKWREKGTTLDPFVGTVQSRPSTRALKARVYWQDSLLQVAKQ